MGTTKAGIYRQYRGPVPRDAEGRPLPASQWPRLRPSSWLVRWFGLEGKRYARSFDTRKEAERFAETKQAEVRQGRADPPMKIMLKTFAKEHKKLMAGNVRPTTLAMQVAVLDLLAVQVGWDRQIQTIRVRDIEAFRAERLKTKISAVTANKEVKLLKGIFNRAIRRGYLPAGTNPCVGLPMIKTTIKRPHPTSAPRAFRRSSRRHRAFCGRHCWPPSIPRASGSARPRT